MPLQLHDIALGDNEVTLIKGVAMIQISGVRKLRLSFEEFSDTNQGIIIGDSADQMVIFGANTDIYLQSRGSVRLIAGRL